MKNHPFVDGTKLIGAHTMLVFLALNEVVLNYKQDELSGLILSVSADKYNYKDTLQWLIDHEI